MVELVLEVLILRFWKALLMPLPDVDTAANLVDDDAGDEPEEVFLQLC